MATIAELIDRHGVDVLEHLDRQVDVPVVADLQAQGDVMVVPAAIAAARASTTDATTLVSTAGVPVVRGEAGGNTHLLLPDGGPVFYDPHAPQPGELLLGVLTVPVGSMALLAHPEHGYAGIAPGTYEVRRQREQADVIQLVAD